MEPITIPPDPARLIEGLRDTGYNFNTAISDIVDNSIVAEAETVDVRIEQSSSGEVMVIIIDDGYGMNEQELLNAMKYGSKQKENLKSLSKFGLGLKTGSTAFCRRLSVISKRTNSTLQRATWDLDTVVDESAWIVERAAGTPVEHTILNEVSTKGSGTIIIWEKVDRLIKNYSNPTGKDARNAIKGRELALIDHLSMVFQRFLDPNDNRAKNISIKINGTPVIPWDPFCEWNSETKIVGNENVPVEMNGTTVSFTVRSFVIPRKEEYKNEADFKKALIRTENQGIYVYRENRLICGPNWLGLFSKEPHMNLLRVEFSFDYEMDDAFHVDIKKSRISLNEVLFDWLEAFLTPQRRAADERYRKGMQVIINGAAKGAHDDSNRGISSKEAEVKASSSEVKDPEKDEVQITNKKGTFTIKMPVSRPLKEGQIVVEPVDSIDDGLLWQPCTITTTHALHHGVRINTCHPYYLKVYMPNIKSGVTVQGMDSLLWALCEAERSIISPDIYKQLQTLRYEVSKILRELVEDLPEPDLENKE